MIFEARFSRADCTPCPFRPQCTKAKNEPRIIGRQSRDEYEALQAARRRQTTDAFRSQYAARAGIESTHEQAVRRCGFRSCRYIGLAKTHLQHLSPISDSPSFAGSVSGLGDMFVPDAPWRVSGRGRAVARREA